MNDEFWRKQRVKKSAKIVFGGNLISTKENTFLSFVFRLVLLYLHSVCICISMYRPSLLLIANECAPYVTHLTCRNCLNKRQTLHTMFGPRPGHFSIAAVAAASPSFFSSIFSITSHHASFININFFRVAWSAMYAWHFESI